MVTDNSFTERPTAEERLREQAALLDAANDAIYVCDPSFRVRYWYRGAERLYGWSGKEMEGRSAVEVLGHDPVVFRQAQRGLKEKGEWTGEFRVRGKGERSLIVLTRWTCLDVGQGDIGSGSILVIETDLTESKRLEAQFLRAQRMEGLGALAGGVAHDLNNILSPILMSAGALKDSGLSADNLAMAQAIEDCAQRGADIVRQLLTFARGEPGTLAVLNLRDLVRAVEKLIRATFPPEVRLESQVSREVWPVMGDALRLHQALMNLCLNARDAMPDGGTLSLALSNVNVDAAYAAMVPGAAIGQYVCLAVSDTGSGIAAEQLDQVFDPYYTTKEGGHGTGLGLPTVLGIVQGLGGFMRINSIVGTGTVVELYLPATAAAEAGKSGGSHFGSLGGQGETLLVVDDETAVRESLRRTLERNGYRVLEASHGAEALAVFARNEGRIQLILTDMMMPVMNGPALVQAVRSIDLRVPIVGMTGLADPKRVKGLERVALTAMLEKPFSGDRLLKTLAVTLPRRGI